MKLVPALVPLLVHVSSVAIPLQVTGGIQRLATRRACHTNLQSSRPSGSFQFHYECVRTTPHVAKTRGDFRKNGSLLRSDPTEVGIEASRVEAHRFPDPVVDSSVRPIVSAAFRDTIS